MISLKNKNIFIAGGSGYLGSVLCEEIMKLQQPSSLVHWNTCVCVCVCVFIHGCMSCDLVATKLSDNVLGYSQM